MILIRYVFLEVVIDNLLLLQERQKTKSFILQQLSIIIDYIISFINLCQLKEIHFSKINYNILIFLYDKFHLTLWKCFHSIKIEMLLDKVNKKFVPYSSIHLRTTFLFFKDTLNDLVTDTVNTFAFTMMIYNKVVQLISIIFYVLC